MVCSALVVAHTKGDTISVIVLNFSVAAWSRWAGHGRTDPLSIQTGAGITILHALLALLTFRWGRRFVFHAADRRLLSTVCPHTALVGRTTISIVVHNWFTTGSTDINAGIAIIVVAVRYALGQDCVH